MKKLLFIAIILCAIVGCTSNSNKTNPMSENLEKLNLDNSPICEPSIENIETIDLNDAFGETAISVDNLLDTLYFLPLKTGNDNLFYGIFKLIVSDERIIIRDSDDRILIFDQEGNFVNELLQGEGPGEIFRLYDFTYDEKNETLIVAQPGILNYYDKDGNHIEDKSCPIISWEFCAMDSGNIFIQPNFVNNNLGENAKFSVLLTDTDVRLTAKGIRFGNSKGLCRDPHYIYKNGDKAIVSLPCIDTIYEVSGTHINAKYSIDFSKNETKIEEDGTAQNPDKYYYGGGFFENSTTQVFNFYKIKESSYIIFRDKTTNKSIGAQNLTCSPDEVPLYCINFRAVYNDYFVTYIDPFDEMHFNHPGISEEDNKKIENMTEDDNAVLVFFKFKKFQ